MRCVSPDPDMHHHGETPTPPYTHRPHHHRHCRSAPTMPSKIIEVRDEAPKQQSLSSKLQTTAFYTFTTVVVGATVATLIKS